MEITLRSCTSLAEGEYKQEAGGGSRGQGRIERPIMGKAALWVRFRPGLGLKLGGKFQFKGQHLCHLLLLRSHRERVLRLAGANFVRA